MPSSIEPAPPVCELTLCPLPGRPALIVNEDLVLALDETEAALTSCAAQVQACIGKQGVMTNAAKGQAPMPRADVSGQDAK
ncbi:Rz1-like lysis system protein LysC [Pseudomonas helleri]|uniref:Rz1-like lysis system protein LysC n=1 Tax=Pseudomonas helleri TaxID=1608996 RepID=UPI001F4D1A06|nr:Rz1-like lysis system protein LysC [Pseudomonas helleri]